MRKARLMLAVLLVSALGCKLDKTAEETPKATEAGNPAQETARQEDKKPRGECDVVDAGESKEGVVRKFAVTVQFAVPLELGAGKFLAGSFGGELKEPKASPCGGVLRDRFEPLYDIALSKALTGTFENGTYTIAADAAGLATGLTVSFEKLLTNVFVNSLQTTQMLAALQHDEPSAEVGKTNRYSDFGGVETIELQGDAATAQAVTIQIDNQPVEGDKKE